MSYYKTEMIGARCDNCKESYYDDHHGWSAFVDESSCYEHMANNGWHETEDGKHYCPKCHTIDDEDNMIITNPDHGTDR